MRRLIMIAGALSLGMSPATSASDALVAQVETLKPSLNFIVERSEDDLKLDCMGNAVCVEGYKRDQIELQKALRLLDNITREVYK